jgi:hypothetical protein
MATPVAARDPEVYADLAALHSARGEARQSQEFLQRYFAAEADSAKRAEAAERVKNAARKS